MSLSSDITRGLEIVREIDRLKAELKAIDLRVEAAALEAEHLPLNEPDREGRQAILRAGQIALPVIFESDLVMASIPAGGAAHAAIRTAIDDEAILPRIWKPSDKLDRVAKDGQSYRQQLRSLLSPETAALVLHATLQRDKTGIPKSRVIISWDRATPIA
jgi:hypothetical protein